MALRTRSYAFLHVGARWINMSMVTDIEEHEERLVLFLATDMARLAGRDEPEAIAVARRLSIDVPDQIEKVNRWLHQNDEE